MNKRHSISICFLIFSFFALSHGASLSGTVKDSAQAPINGVKMVLTGLSVAGFVDSATTGTDGIYSFDSLVMGTYKLSLSCSSFVKMDTGVAVGNGTVIRNFVLDRVKTNYIVSGTWLPSDNPHIINEPAHIYDSLFIAPGCSVVLNKPLWIFGKLVIGSQTGKLVTIVNGSIGCLGDSATVSITRTNCNPGILSQLGTCRKLFLDSTSPLGVFGETVFSVSDSISISRMSFVYGDNGDRLNHYLYLQSNCLNIRNSKFTGGTMQINYQSKLIIDNCFFYNAPGINKSNEKTISNISHSNFPGGMFFSGKVLNTEYDTITNCIILYDLSSPKLQNTPPFSYNILPKSSANMLFGILQNIQTNANGDSCDLWFNLGVDPKFADNTYTVLQSNSPAIKAASDGTNIGCYQGATVPTIFIPDKKIKPSPNALFSFNTSRNTLFSYSPIADKNVTLQIFSPSGKCLQTLRYTGGKQTIQLPLSLSPGTYIYSLSGGKSKITGKFAVQ